MKIIFKEHLETFEVHQLYTSFFICGKEENQTSVLLWGLEHLC